MRDNRFTYLGDSVDEQLRKSAAQRLGVSESDVVRLGVRKLADELGVSLIERQQKEQERNDTAIARV